jgi:hypothetical protein
MDDVSNLFYEVSSNSVYALPFHVGSVRELKVAHSLIILTVFLSVWLHNGSSFYRYSGAKDLHD